jgi:hypothetical protein
MVSIMAQQWVREDDGAQGKGDLGVAGASPSAKGELGVAGASPSAKVGKDESNDGGAITIVEARRSFDAMRGEIEEVRDEQIIVVRVDPQRAAAFVHGVARRDSAPPRREAFERAAAAGEYPIATLERMMTLARAAWYLRRRQMRGLALASEASLLPEAVREAFERRARMMRVIEYWHGHRDDIAAELKYLREGSGYIDLGNDSEALADLYERDDVRATIQDTGVHYRPDDAAQARHFAELVFQAYGLGEKGETERWSGLAQRASTLMLMTYEEHRACGQFLFRKREDVAQSYPSLVTALRTRPVGRKPSEEPTGDGSETPTGGDDGGDEVPAGGTEEVPLAGE